MIDRMSGVDPINGINGVGGAGQSRPAQNAGKTRPGAFDALLQQKTQQTQSLAFSKHARERAEQRGIQVDEQLMDQLNDTVEKAQAKGATNILAFDTNRAFIINVPNGRVITTMSPEEMKENIFTNIDGAVIL